MKKIILIILMVLFSTQAYSAQGVRGRSDTNVSERLATRADQATQTTQLINIAAYTAGISTLTSAVESKLFVTTNGKGSGINIVGAAFSEDNIESARLKFQTQNVQPIEITEEATTFDINKVSDPINFDHAEFNQISISGFNFSVDTAILMTFYFWNGGNNTYDPFYHYVVGYGTPNYNANNENIKFFPNVVGDWNVEENRYGYVDITYLGTATTPSHFFKVDVTVTPFSRNS